MGVTVELRELVEAIGASYDRSLGQRGKAQDLLRQAPDVFSGLLPAGLMPVASGGKGNAAVVPWIAVFQPNETTTAQRGMYLVYLFSADMTTVSLSLNQGVTELVSRFGTTEGRKRLASQAAAIRARLQPDQVDGLDDVIDLRSAQTLPRNYEAGNIVAKAYRANALPEGNVMAADLRRFVRLYELALEVRNALRISTPDTIVTTKDVEFPDNDVEFKPKNDADYLQYFKGRTLRKRRDHERVVKQYGLFLKGRGFTPNTNVHPRDLTVARDGKHWLVEVKVVYRGNGVLATRDALSQLLMYKEYLYSSHDQVCMLAVFSEEIGSRNVEFLERYRIASVWKQDGVWVGSPNAYTTGLAAYGS